MIDPNDNQPVPEPTDAELDDIESSLNDILDDVLDDLNEF